MDRIITSLRSSLLSYRLSLCRFVVVHSLALRRETLRPYRPGNHGFAVASREAPGHFIISPDYSVRSDDFRREGKA